MATFANNGTLTPWRSGEVITADKLNEPVAELNRLRGMTPPYQPEDAPRGGSSLLSCSIVSIHRNHLVCKTKGGSTINVARPLAARSPDSDVRLGNTYNYQYTGSTWQSRNSTKASGGGAEEQVLWEEYKVDGEIIAYRVVGGTGVAEAPTYLEETSLRAWAEKPA